MIEFFQSLSWMVIAQIILIDILLGGDNAIVIALACRHLPEHLRMRGILWGTAGAIGVRIVLIFFAVTLLTLPWVKTIGGLLLLWIGVKLLSEDDDAHGEVEGSEKLWSAIRTIMVADLVMSMDNVIAVASAAEQANADHKIALVAFGIAISIPIVVWGSSLVLKIMDRVPAVITGGAALLGYLGGAMISTDLALRDKLLQWLPMDALSVPEFGVRLSLTGTAGALLVVALGWWISQRNQHKEQALSPDDAQ